MQNENCKMNDAACAAGIMFALCLRSCCMLPFSFYNLHFAIFILQSVRFFFLHAYRIRSVSSVVDLREVFGVTRNRPWPAPAVD